MMKAYGRENHSITIYMRTCTYCKYVEPAHRLGLQARLMRLLMTIIVYPKSRKCILQNFLGCFCDANSLDFVNRLPSKCLMLDWVDDNRITLVDFSNEIELQSRPPSFDVVLKTLCRSRESRNDQSSLFGTFPRCGME